MTSRTVGNYGLLEKLGEGGMGAVYKGVDLMIERTVAIKMLRPEIARQPEIVERFRAEAVALAKLNHPNIATLYNFFREGDEYFMVMEFVAGRTLESIIRDTPPMRINQAVAISMQVLDAIEHAHSYGILHRDIKPANIMLTASGQAKVTDFGIARVLGKARMTREGCIYGTLEYLAPERIRGQEADIRSDLYSMGVVLYETLTKHLPFARDSEYELMRAHLEESPPPFASFGLSSIPPKLEMAVAKALAKRPEERFATASAFRSALAGAEAEGLVEPARLAAEPSIVAASTSIELPARAPDAPSNVSPATPSKRLRWGLAAGVAVLLVLIGLIFAFSSSRKYEVRDATAPAPAPVKVEPPSNVTGQPQAGGQLGVAPASLPSQQHPDIQNNRTVPTAGQGQASGSPSTAAKKPKSPGKSGPDLERRKAALKALDKNAAVPPTTQKTDKDRRKSSLDALKE